MRLPLRAARLSLLAKLPMQRRLPPAVLTPRSSAALAAAIGTFSPRSAAATSRATVGELATTRDLLAMLSLRLVALSASALPYLAALTTANCRVGATTTCVRSSTCWDRRQWASVPHSPRNGFSQISAGQRR